jgi:hypothetical protein
MSRAHYRPPDHSKGNEETIGGYAAVHDRPAAFEGSDGFSYSVEIMAEEAQTPVAEHDASERWGAFFLFVKWARIGAQTPEGHLESEFLVYAPSEAEARSRLGETPIGDVKALLDRLIADHDRRGPAPERRWWDAMRNGDDVTEPGSVCVDPAWFSAALAACGPHRRWCCGGRVDARR